MDLDDLRRRLQWSCSDEFSSLTSKDLKELKWATVSRVFATLFRNCPSLKEDNDALCELMECRNKEMNERRRLITTCRAENNYDRDVRLEEERVYRTGFMRIILSGLTKLRWPPALEAFSDPLDSLLHDHSVILTAFSFIVNFGMPHAREPVDRKKLSPTRDEVASFSRITREIPERDINGPLENISTTILSTGTESSFDTRSINIESPVKKYNRNDTSGGQHNCTIFRGNTESEINDLQFKHGSGYSCRGIDFDAANKPQDYAELLQAFQVSQYQNEILSRQLKRLQASVCARESAELRISSLILELKRSVDEIASVSKPEAANDGIVLQGLGDDNQHYRGMKVKGLFSSVEKKMHNCPGHESFFVWGQLQAKLASLYEQWDQLVKDSRKAVLDYAQIKDKRFIATNPQKIIRQSPPLSSKARGSCLKSASPPTSTPPSLETSHAPTLRLYQVLGVRPSMTFKGSALGDDTDMHILSGDTFLDLSRIHMLQRDLLDFSEDALSFTTNVGVVPGEVNYVNDVNIQKDPFILDPMPIATSVAETQKALESLRFRAHTLILHLACLAPVAPLLSSHPYSSSMTGLDALIEEAHRIHSNSRAGKSSLLVLQSAADRAKGEQTALIRSLDASRKTIDNWSKETIKFSSFIENFGTRISSSLSKFMASFDAIAACVPNISVAFRNAQSARLLDGQIQRSPLDALVRGALGPEVAALVQSLRIHSENLEALATALAQLKVSLHDEIMKEVALFDKMKKEAQLRSIPRHEAKK